MSKRYGRNQKRAARAALEHERYLRAISERRLYDLQAATGEIRARWADILLLIKNTLGADCLLNALAFDVKEMTMNSRRDVPVDVLAPLSKDWDLFEQVPVGAQMKNIRLHPLIMSVGRNAFMDQKIIKLHYKDGSSGYALSEQAMDAAPAHWLAERVARDLVCLLRQRDGDPK